MALCLGLENIASGACISHYSKLNLLAGTNLTAREYRPEVCLAQDAGNLGAFVALNFDLAVLHCATRAASLLHGLGQLLLFRQTDTDKTLHHRYRLAAAPSRLTDDIDATTVLPCRFGGRRLPGVGWARLRRRRESFAGQGSKWVVTKSRATVGGDTFGAAHVFLRMTC